MTHFHEKSKINQNQLIYLVVFYLLIHFDFSFNSMIFWSFFKIKLFILFKSSLYWEIIFFLSDIVCSFSFFFFWQFWNYIIFFSSIIFILNQKIYHNSLSNTNLNFNIEIPVELNKKNNFHQYKAMTNFMPVLI